MINISAFMLNMKKPPLLYPSTTIQNNSLEGKVGLRIIHLFTLFYLQLSIFQFIMPRKAKMISQPSDIMLTAIRSWDQVQKTR